MRLLVILIAMFLCFFLGFGVNYGYSLMLNNGDEIPGGLIAIPISSPEVPSPADRIKEDQIQVFNDKIIITLANPEWASFADTNSMDPILDESSNAIEIVPAKPEDLIVGDIVSYNSKLISGSIIHRIIKISEDDQGWYAIMKGDNNKNSDPERIRFSQIERVVVAIIY